MRGMEIGKLWATFCHWLVLKLMMSHDVIHLLFNLLKVETIAERHLK